MRSRKANRSHSGQSGYVLLAVMLAVTLILIALSVEAPRIAQQIKREKEEELVHRGKDYATAIKRFVHKNGGRYPLSVEQLEDTNHVRFLRKKYKDPMTGESDWKMVHFGEAQINIPAPKSIRRTTRRREALRPEQHSAHWHSSANCWRPAAGPAQPQPGNTGQLGSLTTSNIGTGQTIGGGQIIGVASVNKGQAIKEFNDKDHYDEWYFVYDLRLEQSGGTGVTVAAPRAGGSASGGSYRNAKSASTGSAFSQPERPRPLQSPTKSKSLVFSKTRPKIRCGSSFFYTLKEEPHPQVLFTLGFSNLNPEASSVSTKSTMQPFRYMAEVASTYTFKSSKV